MSAGQAKAGGEIGVNGYFYKGGQFLPSTAAEPGRWKIGKRVVRTGKRMTAPGVWEVQPTPFSVPLFQIAGVGHFTIVQNDVLEMNPGAGGDGVRTNTGEQVTLQMEIRPGVCGVLGTETITLGEIIDAWNNGMRWFDVQPNINI
jgi:hypothetical protein